MREIGQIIVDTFGVQAACGRLYAGDFVVLRKCGDKKQAEAYADEIRKKLEAVRTLAGYHESIYPKVHVRFTDEDTDVQTMLNTAFTQ